MEEYAPCPEPLKGDEGITVVVPISGLESGATYHFRVITESKWGVVTSEDQTFEFFPPTLPQRRDSQPDWHRLPSRLSRL